MRTDAYFLCPFRATGVLMQKDYEVQRRVPISEKADEVRVKGGTLESSDGSVRVRNVSSGWGEDYMIEVPYSRAEGGKYYLDDELLGLVDRGNFYTSSDRKTMYATFTGRQLRGVLERLDKLGVTVREAAKEVPVEGAAEPRPAEKDGGGAAVIQQQTERGGGAGRGGAGGGIRMHKARGNADEILQRVNDGLAAGGNSRIPTLRSRGDVARWSYDMVSEMRERHWLEGQPTIERLLSKDDSQGRKVDVEKARKSAREVIPLVEDIKTMYEAALRQTSDDGARSLLRDLIERCENTVEWYERAMRGDAGIFDYDKPLFQLRGDRRSEGRVSSLRRALRNKVVGVMRRAGMKVFDDAEGQRVLAEENERMRMMGSKTDKKKAKISQELEGREMTPEQQAVVDVYTGAKNNQPITIQREDGDRRVIMRQGRENKGGTLYSLFKHYGTTRGVFSSDDVILIPKVIKKGDITPKTRNSVHLVEYKYTDENGVTYTVLTEKRQGREEFANFYTNKKDPTAARSTHSEEARDSADGSSPAKLQKVSESASENENISQGFGSAATSLNQIPSATKKIKWQEGTVNVDIGGGRFDKATEYLREQGVENLVFDPFNRDAEHNQTVAERVRDEKADTVTCNNVLNVIDSESSRANVILQAAKALKEGGTAYFSVYEGDKSGRGRQTKSDSWQNNRPTKDYVKEIERYFDDVTVKNGVITARNPKATEEKSVWDFDGTYSGNGIKFFRTSSGEAYGFVTNDGRIYIDPEIAGADTPIHEYTHLWAEALRQSDMKAWQRIVKLMKKEKALWDEVSRDYEDLKTDDEIADEVFAHYSGRRGEQRLLERAREAFGDDEARAASAVRSVRSALSKFWNKVAKLLGFRFTTASRVADTVLGDLLSGKNPARDASDPLDTISRIASERRERPAGYAALTQKRRMYRYIPLFRS